jgi:hypothetical protein
LRPFFFSQRSKRAASNWNVGFTRLFIGEALAACCADRRERPIDVADPEPDAVIVPELKLGKVAV